MPSTTTATTTRTGNVVADVTAHVQRAIASGNGKAQHTPAQWAAQCGYPGSKASALRQHIARQHGQGAMRTGHTRYPAVTAAGMLALLQGGHAVRKPDATAQARKQASGQAKRLLWAKRAGASAAKQAKQASPSAAKQAE